MHQTRKNIKSAKQKEITKIEEPLMKPMAQRTNKVFIKTIKHRRQIETDLIGKFYVTSNRGNKYLFVLYEYDSNSILIRLMKAILDREFIRFFEYLHVHLLTTGIKPSYTRLENEVSPTFQR